MIGAGASGPTEVLALFVDAFSEPPSSGGPCQVGVRSMLDPQIDMTLLTERACVWF